MNKHLVCKLSIMVIFFIPLSILTIIFGALRPGSCDYTDNMAKINVSQYLLGLGISSLVTGLVMIFLYSHAIWKESNPFNLFDPSIINKDLTYWLWILCAIVSTIFGLLWVVVGAVVLFRSNVDCIRNGSLHIMYGLVIWLVSFFQIFLSYHKDNVIEYI